MTQTQHVEPVGHRSRVGAYLIDLALFAIVFTVGGFFWSLFAAASFPFTGDLPYVLVFAFIWLGWHERSARKGQSPGRQILQIQVVDEEGHAPGSTLILLRDWVLRGFFGLLILAYFASAQWGFSGIGVAVGVFACGALPCLWDSERQCFWDMALGTRVIYT